MITKDKITEIFCVIDEFDQKFEAELQKNLLASRPLWEETPQQKGCALR